MESPETGTEQRILAAAREVFHKRGYEGARMQEIADLAGINKALLHYYFRNKDNLFQAVFQEAFRKLTQRAISIFLSDKPFLSKLTEFFDYHIGFLQQNSYIPWFILNSIYEKPSYLRDIILKQNFLPEQFLSRLKEDLSREGIDIEDPYQVYVNILSLSIFPIVARPLIQNTFDVTDEKMDRFYEDRKRLLPVFVMNAIKNDEANIRNNSSQ